MGDKQIVLVRHGLTNWNVEKRIQGCSDEPKLTEFGIEQVLPPSVPVPVCRNRCPVYVVEARH